MIRLDSPEPGRQRSSAKSPFRGSFRRPLFGRGFPGVRGTTGNTWGGASMIVNILVWALFGLLAGLVARFLIKQPGRSDSMGFLLTIGLGIAGALVGGYLASVLFNWDTNTFSLPGFAVAVGGSLLLLLLYRLLTSARKSV
jgi:uncharacterized membrane protein YeaQ/YmgE (transglycosylase-associated protein family)